VVAHGPNEAQPAADHPILPGLHIGRRTMLANSTSNARTLLQSVCGSMRVFPEILFVFGEISVKKKSCNANRKIQTAWSYAIRINSPHHAHAAPWKKTQLKP
jgi:hypothetical protein